jgi:hypothetical protein
VSRIAIQLVNKHLAHARGGEVVLYKRPDSKRWQARFKLKDLKWHRVATKHANIQYAAEAACEAYDRARFLFAAKVPISSKRFDVVAKLAAEEMEGQIASGNGKRVYNPRWPLQIPPPVATPNSPRQDGRIMTALG